MRIYKEADFAGLIANPASYMMFEDPKVSTRL
jgi:hypothetical protein